VDRVYAGPNRASHVPLERKRRRTMCEKQGAGESRCLPSKAIKTAGGKVMRFEAGEKFRAFSTDGRQVGTKGKRTYWIDRGSIVR